MTPVSYGGGSTTVVEGGEGPDLTDSFSLGIRFTDSNVAPTDAASYTMALTLLDTNTAPTEGLTLGFTEADSNVAPTDAYSSVGILWGNASAGTGVTNPTNADGPNGNGTAVVSTAPAGSATEIMTSACGNGAAAGTSFTSVKFKGWYKLHTVLSTSTAKVVVHSSTAAFTDIVIESIAAVNTTNDHLTSPFVSPELIGTIDTLVKLQSAQIVYTTIDAIAGTSQAVVTVDASSLLLAGVVA